MTYKLGLTGSIGMGKSTTARMFLELGFPVWDADEAVHRLYAPGGEAVAPIAAAFPETLVNGGIDRKILKQSLAGNPDALKRLEKIVHPLVAEDREKFVREHESSQIVVLDIPLLFEGESEQQLDGVAVVSTDSKTQRDRVLSRPSMTEEHFLMILSRQMPDAEKRARADWIIPTDTLEGARSAVERICKEIVTNA